MKTKFFWEGLKNENIACYLQPIYEVSSGRMNVAEALFRASDRDGNFYDPEQLIKLAEDMDFVSRIDLWMLEEICKHRLDFYMNEIKRVNVNLSPKSYLDRDLMHEIKRIGNQYEVDPGHIWFELTELSEIEDKDEISNIFMNLTNQGFCFALDDFGKGNSNLLRLLSFPFNCIKLDKEVIWSLHENPKTADFVKLLIQFANTHGICVTAEGVETRAQAESLIEMGCHYLQGYYFSKPMPMERFLEFANKNRGKMFEFY